MKVAKYALGSCIGELQAPSQILILHPFQYCKSHFLRFFPHSFFTAMSGKLAILVTKKSSKFFCLGQDPGLPTVAAESGYRYQVAQQCQTIYILNSAISGEFVAAFSSPSRSLALKSHFLSENIAIFHQNDDLLNEKSYHLMTFS